MLSVAALAAFCSYARGEDLLEAAATATDLQSLESAMSSDWASLYYQVNLNLESLSRMGKPEDYEAAVSLYGTNRIPASYVPTWPAGFQSRAEEQYQRTASSSDEESSDTESESETEESSEETTSGATQNGWALSQVAGTIVAAAFIVSYL
ncbi:hypothetical protein LPJ78_002609 [Coemansia sp. RSA 989]|nr:hypothetical protein LPJ78_002609 [Coemansia sp. RSA 989]KAJ1873962.1 hypothetical protein LPJ55_001893 [Coemansia sp. RSA 990]KAJ2670263.1 hypothetical protein IWW42_004095 [Coemansia sp. RSA 1085]